MSPAQDGSAHVLDGWQIVQLYLWQCSKSGVFPLFACTRSSHSGDKTDKSLCTSPYAGLFMTAVTVPSPVINYVLLLPPIVKKKKKVRNV